MVGVDQHDGAHGHIVSAGISLHKTKPWYVKITVLQQ
jgi:hypothetical protein